MQLQLYTGRHDVHQATIHFVDESKKEYVGDWTPEWNEMLAELQKALNMLLAQGYGILDVNIRKTEPKYGIIFSIDITYWDTP